MEKSENKSEQKPRNGITPAKVIGFMLVVGLAYNFNFAGIRDQVESTIASYDGSVKSSKP
jgi:hypothetical protein